MPPCLTTAGFDGELTLQRVVTTCPPPVRPLYWRATGAGEAEPEADLLDDGGIAVGPRTSLHFDTYFGAFYERHWRANTVLGDLVLRLTVEGRFRVRLWRRSGLGEWLIHEVVATDQTIELRVARETAHERQHGLLCFTLTALDAGGRFHGATWLTCAEAATPVGLAVVFCTFNREADIARVLAVLADDHHALGRLARVYVVNQGRPDLAATPAIASLASRYGNKLRIIEQANFGGAGGFTRGLLAALDDQDATHVALLDDDIRFEAESLARMSAFFALAARDTPVGGHMLDLLQPCRLFEAGAVIADRNWAFLPNEHMVDLTDRRVLTGLSEPRPVHYNGWWCFGIPLRLVRAAGLPLPCFIRGDDLEYGLRLHQHGIHTVPLPGVAVWHEPFYVKIGGWQLYYETRNMLIAAALHLEFNGLAVAIRMAKHLLIHLLTFRYYSAALILRGIADFLAGPAILDQNPAALHRSLQALHDRHGEATSPRLTVHPPARERQLPRGRLGYSVAFAYALLRNWIMPTRAVSPKRVEVRQFAWVCLTAIDHVALDTGWDDEMPLFQRSRQTFRALARHGLRLLLALQRGAPGMANAWRDASPRLTSEPFWRDYLGLPVSRDGADHATAAASRVPVRPDA